LGVITRFAPSPTGFLHLGHAASALFAWRQAQEEGGTFLLRIEDIDSSRCRSSYVTQIFEDLRWLGLHWPQPVLYQSQRMAVYRQALDVLQAKGLLYPCFCTRKEAVLSAPQEGDEAFAVYTGACRNLTTPPPLREPALRLDMQKACALAGPLSWYDAACGRVVEADPARFGDVILARRDIKTSYHLAVCVDDAAQGVTLVTRGEDLRAVTDIHCLIQTLLDLPRPAYAHHPLLRDEKGQRLAKRDQSLSLGALRQKGLSPQAVIEQACFNQG